MNYRELQAQYLVLANSDGVRVPKVNPEVWYTLSKHHNKFMRSRDVKVTRIQRSIVAGSVAILQIMEVFTQSSKPAVKDNAKAGLACSRETRGKALQIWLTCPHSIRACKL